MPHHRVPWFGVMATLLLAACRHGDRHTPTGPTGSIELSLSASSVTIARGSSATVSATVRRLLGYAGNVALTFEGLPTGVTAAADPSPLASSATQAQLTLAVGPTVALTEYAVTIRTHGDGVEDVTQDLHLSVLEHESAITWALCSKASALFAASRSDGEDWIERPVSNRMLTFAIRGRGRLVLVLHLDPATTSTTEYFGTADDFASLGTARCIGLDTLRTLTGTVSGTIADDTTHLSFGVSSVNASGDGPFSLPFAAFGTRDYIGTIFKQDPVTSVGRPIRYWYARNVDPGSSGVLPPVDFNTSGITPESHTLQITDPGTDFIVFTYGYVSGSNPTWYYIDRAPPGAVNPWWPIPRQAAGDLALVQIYTTSAAAPFTYRFDTEMLATPSDATVTIGPPIGDVTVTAAAAAAHVRPRVQYAIVPAYDEQFFLSVSQPIGGALHFVTVSVAADYLYGATTLDAAFDDLSSVAGWTDDYALMPGTATWTFQASGGTSFSGFDMRYGPGLTYRGARRDGMTVF
jgi:hypothetical protein